MLETYNLTKKEKIKRFVIECKRVLLMTHKPGKIEFNSIIKVTSIGTFVIGLLGFLIMVLRRVIS